MRNSDRRVSRSAELGPKPGGANAQSSTVQGSMFQVRVPRILSFEGSVTKRLRKILRFVQDKL
jgi:hypothetical protein